MPTHLSAMSAPTILIFGATGDLTSRKLIPALYNLCRNGYLPEKTPIIGVARRDWDDDTFRNQMRKALSEIIPAAELEAAWPHFAGRLKFQQADLTSAAELETLRRRVEGIEHERQLPGQRIVYLALAPELFLPSLQNLKEAGMVPRDAAKLRAVVEKPFGHDLQSAQKLDRDISRLLREEQIFRIDHYLGKETVQNILLFRFGNAIFEPLLNRTHVDHVQITVAESQGIEGSRGGYYDKSGALRDVLQNHVLQLLCLVAMEPPALFDPERLRDEKLKVLNTLRAGTTGSIDEWAVAGQYIAGQGDPRVRGYLEEDRIDADSRTETFVALEARIDNWRWADVPFYLRTGKRLPARVSEIAIQFKLPPLQLFKTVECDGNMCQMVADRPNTLVFRIQPHESISLKFSAKRPGMQYQMQPVDMDFDFEESFDVPLPEAYERLLLDVMRGDSTLFTRSDELEAAWEFCTPILQRWAEADHRPQPYVAGTWGPEAADNLLRRSGREWRSPKGK